MAKASRGKQELTQTTPAPVKPQRADARRNIASILDAAVRCLAVNPDASVGDIAKAAGVGRGTLYGHFPTRAELVDAVLKRTAPQADAVLDPTDPTGHPRRAFTPPGSPSWHMGNP